MSRLVMSVAVLGMLMVSNLVLAGENDFACKQDPGSVTGLTAAGRAVPHYSGKPGAELRHARNATWRDISPGDAAVPVTGCFHEGFLRLELPHIEECAKDGCWIALRWVKTERQLVTAPRPCVGLPGSSVAGSRSAGDEAGAADAEKCVRKDVSAE